MLLVVSVFFVCLGQLQRVQLSHNIAFYGHDFFIVIFLLVTWITERWSVKKVFQDISKKHELWQLLGWGVISLMVNQVLTGFAITAWLYWLRLGCYLLFGLTLYELRKRHQTYRRWYRLLYWMLLSVTLVIGYAQYLLVPDLRFLGESGWDVHFFRLAGTMLDPNFTGMLLVNLLLVGLLKIAKGCKNKLYLGLLIIPALALTFSRSSYLAFLVVMGLLMYFPRMRTRLAKRSLGFILLSFIILIPYLPRPGGLGVELARTETITSRVNINEAVLAKTSVSDLFIGRGLFTPTINLNKAGQVTHAQFPDNLLVFLFSGGGILGLVLAIRFFYQTLRHQYQQSLAGFLLLGGTLVHSMFNLTILEPINLLFLLILLQF